MFTGSVSVLLTSASLKLKSNYQELGYTSFWQMIKETCLQIIYFLLSKFFPYRLNKQLMVGAEYDNNTNNTANKN